MQKVTMLKMRSLRGAYYLTALVFHGFVLFTNFGNYFHGGTPLEWVVMQALAVVIVAATIRMVPEVPILERILMTLCAVAPAVFVIWALIEAVLA